MTSSNTAIDGNVVRRGEPARQAKQRVRSRRLSKQDKDTEMHSGDIRARADRSKIFNLQPLLPRDSVLLALMDTQKERSFAADILGNGRAANWAPRTCTTAKVRNLKLR
jgi:hypothetical protein